MHSDLFVLLKEQNSHKTHTVIHICIKMKMPSKHTAFLRTDYCKKKLFVW